MRSRRAFISLLGGTAAWPVAARGQQRRRLWVLSSGIENDLESQLRISALTEALQKLGWVSGQNAQINSHWGSGDFDLIRRYAAEIVVLKPDVIFALNTPAVAALQQLTREIPIVFVGVTDPLGTGLVTSLAHPGSNITGFSVHEASVGSKWVELLKEVVPRTSRIGLLFNPYTSSGQTIQPVMTAARISGIAPSELRVHDAGEIAIAIAAFAQEPNGALVVLSDAFNTTHRRLITELVAHHGLPAVYPFPYFARDGGLISYGVDVIDQCRQAASYIDRILRGENPGDLPVQAPIKYSLVINVKAAKALGLIVSPMLLARADEVIE